MYACSHGDLQGEGSSQLPCSSTACSNHRCGIINSAVGSPNQAYTDTVQKGPMGSQGLPYMVNTIAFSWSYLYNMNLGLSADGGNVQIQQ